MSLSKTQELLKTHNIIPNKKMGQHFMIDFSIFYKLAKYANLTENDVVLEIGAGLGYLTRFLAKRCKKIIAVEKDKNLTYILEDQLQQLNNISIIKDDILRAKLPVFNKIISIPPYYLSSNLIEWIFLHQFDCAILILQRAFAEKLSATSNSQAYGWLSVVTQYFAKVEQLDILSSDKFFPKPEVDSKIIRITPQINSIKIVKNSPLFANFVKSLFSKRNKKLVNSLYSFLKCKYNFSKLDTEKFLSKFVFSKKRVRQLTVQEFGELTNALPK